MHVSPRAHRREHTSGSTTAERRCATPRDEEWVADLREGGEEEMDDRRLRSHCFIARLDAISCHRVADAGTA